MGLQLYEKSRLHREQAGAAVYVAPNCTAALSHLDLDENDFKGTDYRGVSGILPVSGSRVWQKPILTCT